MTNEITFGDSFTICQTGENNNENIAFVSNGNKILTLTHDKTNIDTPLQLKKIDPSQVQPADEGTVNLFIDPSGVICTIDNTGEGAPVSNTTGPTGVRGFVGSTGIRGPTGIMGQIGLIGPTGADGSTSDNGLGIWKTNVLYDEDSVIYAFYDSTYRIFKSTTTFTSTGSQFPGNQNVAVYPLLVGEWFEISPLRGSTGVIDNIATSNIKESTLNEGVNIENININKSVIQGFTGFNTNIDLSIPNNISLNAPHKMSIYANSCTLGISSDTVVYVLDESAFPAPIGTDIILVSNITYIIVGQIVITNSIVFSNNNSIVGLSNNCSITFTSSLIGFKSTNTDVNIKDISIINGGDNSIGLFELNSINYSGTAPNYNRNNIICINNVIFNNIIKYGYIDGFKDVNITNCIFDGNGNTSIGIQISNSLHLSIVGCFFNNFLGSSDSSSNNSMLVLRDNDWVNNGFGFETVTITSNTFHPESQENGIEIQINCTTINGIISNNNVLSHSTTGEMIKYSDSDLFNNYNTRETINYDIYNNIGITNSETCINVFYNNNNMFTNITQNVYSNIETSNSTIFELLNDSVRIGVKNSTAVLDTTYLDNIELGDKIVGLTSGNTAHYMGNNNSDTFYNDMTGLFEFGEILQNIRLNENFATAGLYKFECMFANKTSKRARISSTVTIDPNSNDIRVGLMLCLTPVGQNNSQLINSTVIGNAKGRSKPVSLICSISKTINKGDVISLKMTNIDKSDKLKAIQGNICII